MFDTRQFVESGKAVIVAGYTWTWATAAKEWISTPA